MNSLENDPHKDQPTIFEGAELSKAKAGMILIHGRGADAQSILTLTTVLADKNFLYAAPQAKNNSWYPFSFLSPIENNEPGITSGLNKINSTFQYLNEKGISSDKIILTGFSQGACLALEYCSRFPQRLGGVIGLSGGLIGPNGIERKISGSLNSTKIFLGCSDIDPHIPVERVHFTEEHLTQIGGAVTKIIYPGMGHTINDDEIKNIKKIMNELSEQD
jgi:predicted esterase